jgi:hypothetical protein
VPQDGAPGDVPAPGLSGSKPYSEASQTNCVNDVPAEGGIWRGSDSAGHEYLLMAAPGACMTRIADLTLGYAGDGLDARHASDDSKGISGYGYWAYPRLSEMASYAWSLCILDADWEPRRPIQGLLSCAQMPDGEWLRSVDLAFDPLYDAGASRSLLSRHWTDVRNPGVDVASFDASGQLTGQNGASGCVYLGNASAIDERYNVYEIEWSFANCTGDSVALNGVAFTGLATIDSTREPMTLTFLGTGFTRIPPYEENGRAISFIAVYEEY